MSVKGRPNQYEANLRNLFKAYHSEKKGEQKQIKPVEKRKKVEVKMMDDGFFGEGSSRIIVPTEKPIDNGEFLPPCHLIIEVMGKGGSGKSFYLTCLLPQLKLSQIVIFSSLDIPIYTEISKYCEKNGILYYKGTTIEDFDQITEQIKEEKPANTWGILIFDDWNINMTTSRNDKYQRKMNLVNGMYRNLHYHQCYITQSALNISTLSRANANVRVIFAMNDTYAIDSIKRDFINITGRTEEDFMDLFDVINKNPHSFLQISDTKIYIYIPKEMKTLEEVDFGDGHKLEDDAEFNKMCTEYKKRVKTSIDAKYHEKIKIKLQSYINYLLENNKLTKEDIIKYMKEKYDI